ncbi:MAG: hypothetical protein IJM71_01570 [Clostridia bacterium]|nr:hypothetical protein [Clostridia bacterium]
MKEKGAGNGIFRSKSTERVSGPEALNDYIHVTTPKVWIVLLALVTLLAGILIWSIFGTIEVRDADGNVKRIHPISYVTDGVGKKTDSVDHVSISYDEFKELPADQRKETFAAMSGKEIYDLVAASDENWPVTSYDLITPDNAKEAIVLYDNNGDLHFNLSWPCYGGFLPESIASVGDLSGTLDVSRDGGDGGHSMSFGRNADGSYPDDSQRSVPKSSANVRTGVFDVDRYLQVLDVVTNGKSEEDRISELCGMGYSREIAARFLEESVAFLSRDEISGPNNINDGAVSAGRTVESKYGYYGVTAPWKIGDLELEGGGNQLCTVFSWGALCDSGLIHDTGTAEIH